MTLREEILREHSKQHTMRIAQWVGASAKRFQEIMHLFVTDEYRVVQRCASIIYTCSLAQPEWIKPYVPLLLEQYNKVGVPTSVKRNVLKLFQEIPVPEEYESILMGYCFDALADAKEAIAVRCFSMSILSKLSVRYPDIKNELTQVIHDVLVFQEPSPAFRARAKQVLKEKKRKDK